jgi:tRNA pseudouridine32 synthase/23S rRNA pseudouridine746 synthase
MTYQPPTVDGVSASALALPPGPWHRVLDYLVYKLPAVSQTEWTQRMNRGDVLDEQGNRLSANSPYKAHSKVYYYRRLDQEVPIPFEESVLFQDDYLVVADKPHFLPVTPSGRYVQETLLVRLKRKLGIDTLTPMHRIDRDTAGLVLFSIQPDTRAAYQQLFRDKTIRKHYEAIAPRCDTMSWPLTHNSRLQESTRFMAMEEVPGPPNAQTVIDVIEHQGRLTRYSLQPITGQKHQLRAHMSALGLPIVGDLIYPVLQPDGIPDYTRPLKLLAKSVVFTDPITGQQRQFESTHLLDWPADSQA